VFDAYIDGEVSIGLALVVSTMDPETQRFLLTEILEKKLQVGHVEKIKRHLKEGASMAEALARATGEMPEKREPARRSFDGLLDEINKLGAKWRTLVSMAMDAASGMEHELGAGSFALFEKVYALRHSIGEQYAFVDQKVKRFVNTIKKNVPSDPAHFEPVKHGRNGGQHGFDSGSGEGRDGDQAGDGDEAGQVVPDSADEA